ncbi:MAG TPA: nitroreductase family protein [Anaerolineales bacterium]|nr:nitroreductase family protein [Anaerolineales bacterium]
MITTLLKQRVSVRSFQNKPVPEEVIQDLLEAARLSPSGGNKQPWLFGVITDCALIKQVSKLAHGQKWTASAPLIIVLCTVCVNDEHGGRDIQKHRYPHFSWDIAQMPQELYWALNQEEHQTKIPGAHMILAALEHGVASCWVSRFHVMQLAQLLKLPPHYLPSEILVFGYPEFEQEPRSKKSLDELVFRIASSAVLGGDYMLLSAPGTALIIQNAASTCSNLMMMYRFMSTLLCPAAVQYRAYQ